MDILEPTEEMDDDDNEMERTVWDEMPSSELENQKEVEVVGAALPYSSSTVFLLRRSINGVITFIDDSGHHALTSPVECRRSLTYLAPSPIRPKVHPPSALWRPHRRQWRV